MARIPALFPLLPLLAPLVLVTSVGCGSSNAEPTGDSGGKIDQLPDGSEDASAKIDAPDTADASAMADGSAQSDGAGGDDATTDGATTDGAAQPDSSAGGAPDDAETEGGSPADAGCVPKTCQDLNATCGTPPDGCGQLLASCGTCSTPAVCGGGGTPFQCACSTGTWTTGIPSNLTQVVATSIAAHGGTIDIAGLEGFYTSPPQTVSLWTTSSPGFGAWNQTSMEYARMGVGLAVDPAGVDHLVYADLSGDSWWLHETHRSGTSYATSVVDFSSTCDVPPSPSIASDSSGNLHVLYESCSDGLEHYAYLGSGQTTWQTSALAISPSLGPSNTAQSAIAVDSSGGLYAVVGARDPSTDVPQVLFGYRAPGLAWPTTFTVLDAAGGVSSSSGSVTGVQVAVDSTGGVYVVYSETQPDAGQTLQALRAGYRPSGGSWTFWTLDFSDASVGANGTVALAVSPANVAHVAYIAGDHSKIMHTFGGAGSAWRTEIAVDGSYIATYYDNVSIAVDSSEGVHLAYTTSTYDYYDGEDGQLAYSYRCP